MTWDVFIALVIFAFALSLTPGPNNLMLMASGANFGMRRTVPHMLGVALGFVFLAASVGAGLAGIFQTFPIAVTLLEVVSVVYMLWLALKIARSSTSIEGAARAVPMTFLQAAAFQWVNPKAWAMALSAVTLYAPERSLESVVLVAVIFGVVNLPAISLWVVIGQQVGRILTNRTRLVAFNRTMAVLLVASLVPILWH